MVLVVTVLFIGLTMYCVVQFAGVRTRLEQLQARLRGLDLPATAPAIAPEPGPKAYEREAVLVTQAVPELVAVAPRVALSPELELEPEPPPERGPILNWEMFAGGRLLNVIGAIVLVLGVGLFLKYAFDQNWITAAMRVASGVVLGAGLVTFGEFCHRRGRQQWFSQGVLGAGLGVLYVSGHAAFANYHLVPFTVAYAFMSLVTVAAFLLALRYDALSVALLGWLGGFVTPFVLNDGTPDQIGLASYLVLLDLGVVAIAMVKGRWFVLEPLALVASYFAMIEWFAHFGDPSSWFVSTIALLSIWLLFFAASVAQVLRAPQRDLDLRQLLGLVNAGFFWGCSAAVLHGHNDALQAVLAIAGGAYALAYALLLARSSIARAQRIQWYGTGLAFLFGLTWLHFPNPCASTVVVAVEGLALVAIDLWLRKRTTIDSEEATIGAAALLTAQCFFAAELSTVGTFLQSGWHFDFTFGARDLAIAAASAGFVALQALAARRPNASGIAWLLPVLRIEAVLALIVFTACHLQGFALADAYALEAVMLAFIGTRRMLREMEVASLGLLAMAGICAAVAPDAWWYQRIFSFDPWHNGRLLATAVLPACALLVSENLLRRSLLPGEIGRVLRIAAAAGVVVGVTLQVRDSFELARAISMLDQSTAAAQDYAFRLGNLEQVAISLVWIVASLVLIGLGIGFRLRDLRLMAIALFDLTILKAFFYDLGGLDGLYRVGALISLGLVLLLVSYIYQRVERGGLPMKPAAEAAV